MFMTTMRNREVRRLIRFELLLALVLFASAAIAQPPDDDVVDFDPNAAPPPVRAMSDRERSQLDAEQGLKGRTKLALAMMSSRLSKAEEFSAKEENDAMYNELGGFHALMDDTLEFLESAPRKDKTLDNLKRFEMTLRGFAPRLALIRREIPIEYDHYVRVLLKYLRDARSKAIEPLFGNSVVPARRNS